MLVNDLDLRVVAPDGTTNFPWVLNPNSPAAGATTGDNVVDNVEQVSIPNPATSTYLVRITHKGVLLDDLGSQSYQDVSIVLSGNVAQPPILPRLTSIMFLTQSNDVALRWTSEVGRVYRIQSTSDISTTWEYVTGELSATKTNTAIRLPTLGAASQFYRVVQVG